ncbi:MAG: hypothetical protein ACPG7F_17660 [Aggregatilineales bacterium]
MKHNTTTLLRFLKTGKLGSIQPGMTDDTLLNYMGDPDSQKTNSWGECDYYYPGLHLGTEERRVTSIIVHTQDFPERDLPMQLGDGWFGQMYMMQLMDVSTLLHGANMVHSLQSHTIMLDINVFTFLFYFMRDGYFSELVYRDTKYF